MTTNPRQDINPTRVAWIASQYGYGGDLMYFAGLFASFVKKFRYTKIYVTKTFPVERYPGLPLSGSFRFYEFGLRRNVRDVSYDATRRFPDLRSLWVLARIKCDVAIFIEFAPISLLGLMFMWARRRPALLLIENDPIYRGGADTKFSLLIKRSAVRLATVVMTNSQLGRQYVEHVLRIDAKKLLVAPYLTSVPPLGAGSELSANNPVRRPGRLNYLFINSVTERKGLRQLVLSIARCSLDVRENIFLHVVGDGSMLECIRELSKELGIDDKIEFYGRVAYAQTRKFFSAADVFVSPTLGDYRSLGGFEALNCGMPVLISKYDGAHIEVVEEGRNGFVCDPLDLDDLAEKLTWFQKNSEKLPAMARASCVLSSRFSYEEVVNNIEFAIKKALV